MILNTEKDYVLVYDTTHCRLLSYLEVNTCVLVIRGHCGK